MIRMWSALALVVVFLLVSHPCKANQANESSISSLVREYLDASRNKQIDHVRKLSHSMLKRLVDDGFRGFSWTTYVEGWGRYPVEEVSDIQIHDDFAQVNVSLLVDDKIKSFPVQMIYQQDKWWWNSLNGFMPVDGLLRLELGRSKQYSSYHYLDVFTQRNYGCSNYTFRYNFYIMRNEITIRIYDIYYPGACSTAVGPARMRIPLEVPDGKFVIKIVKDDVQDTYELAKNGKSMDLKRIESSFTEISEVSP